MSAPIQANLFQGFGRLEDLILSHPPADPIMVASLEEPGSADKMGVAFERIWITVQDLAEGRVRYCRILAGGYTTINGGKPFQPELAENARARALDLFDKIVAFIRRQGITVVEQTTIAAPADLKLLTGMAACLRYNKDTDRFELTEDQ